MKLKNEIRIIVSFLLVTIVLLVTSCVDGFKEDYLFSSGVKNTTLQSPDSIAFTPSSDGATVKISWPVVYGAGGYQLTFYRVDDPANPVVVGQKDQVIDGCSTTRDLAEDSKYKVVIKTLGDSTLNNKAAISAKEAAYSTLLPALAVIPTGTDLAQYFASNPIPSSTTELAYQLEAGGVYTMSANIPLGLTKLTIRGDKIKHSTITMSTGVLLSDGAGLKLKFLDFDCSGFTGSSLITYNPTQNAAVLSNGYVVVTSPIAIQSCKITNLATKLIWDSAKKYSLQSVIIKDCIIGMNSSLSSSILIHIPGGGIIKDLSLTNSTFYNKQVNSAYFIQYGNTKVATASNSAWASASVSVNNCTFWQVAKTGQMANYTGMAYAGNYLTIQKSIFVDCGNQQVIRRFSGQSPNMTRTYGYNSYWYNGAFVTTEVSGSYYDNSGSHITTDPALKDPANADFTVGGTTQISTKTGDPRWLPVQ